MGSRIGSAPNVSRRRSSFVTPLEIERAAQEYAQSRRRSSFSAHSGPLGQAEWKEYTDRISNAKAVVDSSGMVAKEGMRSARALMSAVRAIQSAGALDCHAAGPRGASVSARALNHRATGMTGPTEASSTAGGKASRRASASSDAALLRSETPRSKGSDGPSER